MTSPVTGVSATRTWFITGASTGLGRALAAKVLERGDRVAVTARDTSRLDLDLRGRGVALAMDLRAPDTFLAVLRSAEAAIGPINVLVNNAGQGLVGAVEETSDDERREQMEVNFLGPAALTTLVIPGLRERQSGAIVNISSTSGVLGPPGSAYYAASKHALEGWSDSLRAELAPFGVSVIVVQPGPFRTAFFRARGQTHMRSGLYPAVDERRAARVPDERQVHGDPDRGAAAIIRALETTPPPRWLPLGNAAHEGIRGALTERISELAAWQDLARSADRPLDPPVDRVP